MIALLKHGQTEDLGKIINGHLPTPLSETGKQQAVAAANALADLNIPFHQIQTSDLKRTVQTAEIIGKILNLPIVKMEILRERNAGEATGKSEEQINWTEYEKKPLENRAHSGGETLAEVKRRAEKFWAELQTDNVIVVGHDAFLKMLIAAYQNIPIEQAINLDLENKLVILDKKNRSADFIPYSR